MGNSSLHEGEKNQYGEDSLAFQVHSGFNKKNMNRTVAVDRPDLEEPAPRNPSAEYLETCQDEDNNDDFLKVTIDDRADPTSEKAYENYKRAIKYLEKQEKQHFEKSDYKSLSKIIAKVVRILEKIEAKGISLVDVFKYHSWNQRKQFKTFFINLDIWGTWEAYNKQEVDVISTHLRNLASEKVEFAKISLFRCLALMKDEKGRLFEIVRFKVNILYNAFEKISEYLKIRTEGKSLNPAPDEKPSKPQFSPSPVKSIDLMKIDEEEEPRTEQTDEEKFESIRLEEPSKIDDSQMTEEFKLENDKNEYLKFTTQNVEDSYRGRKLDKKCSFRD